LNGFNNDDNHFNLIICLMYKAGALQQIECYNLIVLTLICIRKNNCVGVTAVVEKQSPHRAIRMLGGEDLHDLHHRSIQAEVNIPSCIQALRCA
jgi:hypothetical protein